ncbi:MAG: TonB-dependent receptor [Bacteroidetes bacterium]|nr:TonB-dependent receptor [Bacteroidota bacterium]
MYKCLLSLVLILISFTSFGATLTGTVKDSTDNSPLIGVIVNIKNTSFVAQTDPDGKYEIKGVPNGKFEVVFSFITYEKRTLPVTIKGGQDAVLDAIMAPEGSKQQLNAVTVTATRTTHTEAAVLQEIKNSNTVVSGIGSAQISKTMDRNAADVVKRVPGVTIQDDRFIVVRGLADRYNTVWLNDAGAPSSETDKKAFSFDIIPSGLIDRILISKTPSPELPGDFAGGMVKVYTTSLVDRNQVTVGFQTSSREFTTGRPFFYNTPSKTDWLGYDNGQRELPSSIPGIINKSDPNQDINAITKSFKNDWVINNKNASPDYRFGLALSNAFNLGKIRLGNTLGLAYSNTKSMIHYHRMDWQGITESYNYNDNYYANNVGVGLMDNLGIAVGNSKIEFKTLYSQIGRSSVTERTNIRDTSNQSISSPDEKSYKLDYESRATYATELSGVHKSNNDNRKYTWALGYSDLFKNTPDTRRIKYTKPREMGDSAYSATIAPSVDIYYGGGKFYSQLFEHIYSFNHQFTQKIHIGDNFKFDVNAGNYVEYKSRYYYARELGYTVAPGQFAHDAKMLPINEIFADTNVGQKGRFLIDENSSYYDRYGAKNTLIASFVSVNIPLWDKLTIVGGVRYENNTQELDLYKSVDTFGANALKLKTQFWLPSVNVSYNLTDKMLVRGAFGKTLNRPEFREMAPSPYYNFDDREFIYGSLFPSNIAPHGDTLKVTQVNNYDLRWEWYPGAGEMIQVGVFYKSFKDPIQKVIDGNDGSGSKNITFINGTSAYCEGVEIDLRKNLAFADDLFNMDIFKDFSVVGNLSLTKSQLTFDTTALAARLQNSTGLYPKNNLQGQSPYVVNAGIYYQNEQNGFQGSILYNVFARRVYAVGKINSIYPGDETIYEMPFKSFDATISKTFFKHYILNIGVQNILNSTVTFMKDINADDKIDNVNDREYKSFKPGSIYTIGVKVKF